MPIDSYKGTSIDAPADDGDAVTISDTIDLVHTARALYIGVTGDVKVITKGGSTLTFKNAQQGSVIPIRATRVFSTGTTATNIIALL